LAPGAWVEGTGNQEVVLASPGVQHPLDVSADGRRLIYLEEDRITRADLWMLPLFGERKPIPLLRHRSRSATPRSPRMACAGVELISGPEVRHAVDAACVGRVLIGGQTPRWRRDGKELFYLTPDGGVMRVAMTLSPTLDVGSEEQLFVVTGRAASDVYDVSPDGQRFLINTSATGDPAPITVILNWLAAVRQ
jgi:Tol biopolymer transport system component